MMKSSSSDRFAQFAMEEFGGGASIPPPPPPPPAPTKNEAARGAAAQQGRRKPQGYQSTILTSEAQQAPNTPMKTLLGQ